MKFRCPEVIAKNFREDGGKETMAASSPIVSSECREIDRMASLVYFRESQMIHADYISNFRFTFFDTPSETLFDFKDVSISYTFKL